MRESSQLYSIACTYTQNCYSKDVHGIGAKDLNTMLTNSGPGS